MLEHGLSSGVEFSADMTVGPVRVVLLLEVSVQRLDEGSLLITEVTAPWLVVRVISVHVVHQPSESAALFATQLTEAELLTAVRYFLLGAVSHSSCFWRAFIFVSWPPSLSFMGKRVSDAEYYN